MYANILIPVDGSEVSLRAAEHGVALAKFHNAKVTGITVVSGLHEHDALEGHTLDDMQADFKALSEEQAKSVLAPLANAAAEAEVGCDLHFFRNVTPNEGIMLAVERHHCDLIVMGTHARHGLSKLLLGNETQKVISGATVPVLVVR